MRAPRKIHDEFENEDARGTRKMRNERMRAPLGGQEKKAQNSWIFRSIYGSRWRS